MTSKQPQSVVVVGNPIQMPIKTPFLAFFWKLAMVYFEDTKGKGGIFSPLQGPFVDPTEGVFAKTTSNSFPLWHFPHPDPLSRATLPGLCPVSFLVSSSLWGTVQFSTPSCTQGIGFPIASATLSGFRHKSKSPKTHLRTVVRCLDQVGNPIPVGSPTPLTHIVLSGF